MTTPLIREVLYTPVEIDMLVLYEGHEWQVVSISDAGKVGLNPPLSCHCAEPMIWADSSDLEVAFNTCDMPFG